MIRLQERWTGYGQGERIEYIVAEVYSPCQEELMTKALRIATGSATCVHPRDWPPFSAPNERRQLGGVWPETTYRSTREERVPTDARELSHKAEGEEAGSDSAPPPFRG